MEPCLLCSKVYVRLSRILDAKYVVLVQQCLLLPAQSGSRTVIVRRKYGANHLLF